MPTTGKANHGCAVLEGSLGQTERSRASGSNVLGLFVSTELRYSLRKEHALTKNSVIKSALISPWGRTTLGQAEDQTDVSRWLFLGYFFPCLPKPALPPA